MPRIEGNFMDAEFAEVVSAIQASVAAHDQVSEDKDTMMDAGTSFSELLQVISPTNILYPIQSILYQVQR